MITLDLMGGQPIYEQIIEQMKRNVIKGYLKPGDAIPSVRRLALELSITPGTVAKAYQELERQKVIVTVRGRGTFIAEQTVKLDEDRLDGIRKNMSSNVLELKMMGMSKKDITELVNMLYDELK